MLARVSPSVAPGVLRFAACDDGNSIARGVVRAVQGRSSGGGVFIRGCTEISPTRALLVVLLLCGPDARAGEWHTRSTLVCSECHTMHNSRGGQPMRYDVDVTPAGRLLRAETTTALCLACHRGDNPTSQAPAVTSPSSSEPPGGGFPSDLSDPLHHAHTLGSAPVLPPSGDSAVVMTCVTCHAPHGNDAFRNLVASPSGKGRAASAPLVAQLVTANGTNAPGVYVRANVRYVSGMSAWCMDCHNTLTAAHAQVGTLTPHPWDCPILRRRQRELGRVVGRGREPRPRPEPGRLLGDPPERG